MGEQLFAVVYKKRVETKTKTGKMPGKLGARLPCARTLRRQLADIETRLAEKLPEWEALDLIPSELLPMNTESWTHGNTPAQYGARLFRDLFLPRQLLCHGTSVEIYRASAG